MSGRQQVLVLDADDNLLIELERLLEDAGFDVTTTWELREAHELLCSRHFDFVLVGDHPPEIPASAVLEQIRDMQSAIQCVVLNAPAHPSGDYFQSLGAFAVIGRHRHQEVVQLIKKQPGNPAKFTAA
jgi:DNA-binding NtrC family response regulator